MAPDPEWSNSSASSPRFAVAFGGGGARGLAHIHVIETLNELGIVPVAISGASIGSIMGAAMAAGLRGVDIRRHALSVLGRRGEVAARLWRSRPQSVAELMAGGIRLGQFDVERILRVFLPDAIPTRFDQLDIPLRVVATDYFAHCPVVVDEGEIVPALAASAAIPALFRPVRRDGRILIDGGVSDPVPYGTLAGLADVVIAVDVIGTPTGDASRMPTSIDMIYGANQIMMQAILSGRLEHSRPQILLRPPVSRFRVLDFLRVEEVLAETQPIGEELRRAIHAAVEACHHGNITKV